VIYKSTKMVNFTVEQLREIMGKPEYIRNMSVIAHVDHGKSTLTDSLIAKAGIISQKAAGQARFMDTREDEQDRGITIKSTGVSLAFNLEGHDYIFNLIDSPGHVDFSSEVTAALRVTDGALVVVDCVEGVCVQTETVLRQAMQEKIMPVLMVNKVDRAVLELKLDGESMYKNFVRVIDRVNVIVETYAQPDMGDCELNPVKGNIAFGSGKDVWGFTLAQFARMYSKKFGIEVHKMMHRLWGDNFFDAKAKVWRTANIDKDGNILARAFVQFIVDPIVKVAKACLEANNEQINKLMDTMGVKLSSEERELTDKKLMRTILQKWINAADALLEMMIHHLPSPKKAQSYRAKYLYEGPEDDECCTAMKNCDSEGPLMMYVSKMVPTSDKGRFYAFGRIFSGKIAMGQKVRIMGPNYTPGSNVDLLEKTVQRTVIMMGRKTEFVPDVPCGNTVALVGIDQGLTKTGTITSHEKAYNIRVMKYSVSPVVRVAVKPKNQADLPKLIAGMQQLAKSDPLVLCINDQETGENVICGSGELHMEICLKDLVDEYAKIEIIKSDPVVAYRETVREQSAQAMSKSANAHNRLYCTAQPLTDEFVTAIENGEINFRDPKERLKTLTEKFDWDKNEASKIWSFGPDGEGPNVIVDATSACQFMNEIKEHMVSGFEIVTKAGVLCDEMMRGIRFNVHDTSLHTDSIHRGGGQISPATRRVLFACELMAKPTLQEPIFQVEITAPNEVIGAVYSCMAVRRGTVDEEIQIEGTPLTIIKAYLPVAESFGFTSYLRQQTSGKAFPNCVFDHWEALDGDALKADSKLNKLIGAIRVRKGLKEAIPDLSNFLDKL
jgi:elongation factor 2